VSTLRGELEPKALEARELAVERERLAGELSSQRNEANRVAVEREEQRVRELAQLTDAHAREQSTQSRLYAAELARAHQERDAQTLALQQASRSADARAQAHEHELAELGDSLKRNERELAEVRERVAKLEAENASAEELLATAGATTERLFDDKRALEEQLGTSQADARRNSLDRLRFVAYLEEGLALLGALPPTAEDEESQPEISVEDA
jgi:chromosome segregation ATPase